MAVFSANPATIGVPDFGLIHIDPSETASSFQAYLDTASKLTGVSLEDISVRVGSRPQNESTVTLVDLLKVGMKLFDAVVWLHAGRPTSHPLRVDPTITPDKIPSLHTVARAVFYCYFMLLTQARYPSPASAKEKAKIPNFLRVIMGMEEAQETYVETICSFEPQKFDPTWVKYIRFENFGQEVLSRFGLGVAGYRMFGPFKLYDPKPSMPSALQGPFDFARTLAKSPATWDIHPLTRKPTVLTTRGNLNKNLGNLILECFSDDQIDEMVKTKIIFQKPVHDPQHRDYKTWVAQDDISGISQIF